MNPEDESVASQRMRATWWHLIAEPPPGIWWEVVKEARTATYQNSTTVAHREAFKAAMTRAIKQEAKRLQGGNGVVRSVNARLGETVQVNLLESAAEAAIDTIRSHTLLLHSAVAVPTREEAAARAPGLALVAGEALLEGAHAQHGPMEAAAMRRRVEIDDDHVYEGIHGSRDVRLTKLWLPRASARPLARQVLPNERLCEPLLVLPARCGDSSVMSCEGE